MKVESTCFSKLADFTSFPQIKSHLYGRVGSWEEPLFFHPSVFSDRVGKFSLPASGDIGLLKQNKVFCIKIEFYSWKNGL